MTNKIKIKSKMGIIVTPGLWQNKENSRIIDYLESPIFIHEGEGEYDAKVGDWNDVKKLREYGVLEITGKIIPHNYETQWELVKTPVDQEVLHND